MGKSVKIIKAIGGVLGAILPKSCKSKCCSGSECSCNGEKNLIVEEKKESVINAEV